jgi:glycosyltransferase involved in cell wall biosynthesis
VKRENGGKHRAINQGVSMAQGELFFIVDSDDYLPDQALEIIDSVEKTIPDNTKANFAGVCGQKGYSEETPIGKSFEGDILDITTLQRSKYHVTGDKSEVFYTDILRRYPFPEYKGENFVTECVVWDQIAADGYKLRFFNHVVMICEYLPDGLSAQGNTLFEKNPKAWGLYIYQCGLFGKISGIAKWNEILNYYYTTRNKLTFRQIARILHMHPIILWLRLFGLRLFYRLYG